jgi:hypothetical protein
MAFAPVNTYWIDEEGREADLYARVGRRGDDVATFALHTMGWVRLQEIVRYWEIEFDPRATQPAAIASLCDLVRRLSTRSSPWMATVRVFNGADWLIHSTFGSGSDEADKLIGWIEAVAHFGWVPRVPSGLGVFDLGEPNLNRIDDSMLSEIAAAWQSARGEIRSSAEDPFMNMRWAPLPRRSVKVLVRDVPSKALVFASYFPACTELWAERTVRRFRYGRVVEEVPDRALAAKVIESAETTLAQGRPRAERLKGLVQKSDASVVHVDWERISLPARLDGAAKPNAVIVYCHASSVLDLRQAASA